MRSFHLTLPSVAVSLDLLLLGHEGDSGATARLADGGDNLGEGDFSFHTGSRTQPLAFVKRLSFLFQIRFEAEIFALLGR